MVKPEGASHWREAVFPGEVAHSRVSVWPSSTVTVSVRLVRRVSREEENGWSGWWAELCLPQGRDLFFVWSHSVIRHPLHISYRSQNTCNTRKHGRRGHTVCENSKTPHQREHIRLGLNTDLTREKGNIKQLLLGHLLVVCQAWSRPIVLRFNIQTEPAGRVISLT